MKSRHRRVLAGAVFWLGLASAASAADGIVVEAVGKGSALEGAGLREGDVLVAWERPANPPANPDGAKGELRTAFDWLWLKAEQAPRGPVRLHGERNGLTIGFAVPRGDWDARVRPRMPADILQTYAEGRRQIESGDVEGGIRQWDALVRRGEPDLASWILYESGVAWSKAGQGDRQRTALSTALEKAQDAATRVAILEALGESYRYANEMARAESTFHSALEAGTSAETLRAAGTMTRLGNVLRLQDRLDEAAQVHARALEIRQRWAPEGAEVADSLHQLFLVSWARDDQEAMADYSRRSLAIWQQGSPDSLGIVDSLNDVALLAIDRGRYEEATGPLQRAVAILEQRSPESLDLALTLGRLGFVVRHLGDADAATELLRRALAIRQKLAPNSLGTAALFSNLAGIARERGDLSEATELFQRSLRIWEKAAPQGRGAAGTSCLLALVAKERGDLDTAWDLLRRALEIMERISPGGLDVSFTLSCLGMVAEARGDLKLALDFYRRAQAVTERWAPDTVEEALTLHQLGRLSHLTGHSDQAAELLARAVAALESQVDRLRESQDLQASFRARHEEIYRDAIDVELERGHAAEAFHLLERSRARSFLMLLAQRDLELAGELPAALERSRRNNAARYDKTLKELAHWTAAAGDEARQALLRELSRLRGEREGIAAEIRQASPRVAALRQPQPLDLAAARQVLDPGTLALSYSVGTDQTALFAITREGGLQVEILPLGEERLRREVEQLLEQVRQPAPLSSAGSELARSLYRSLIGPVAGLVERSQRVLIVPDGPLHRLPFGALIRDPGGQYLVEWKPLHTALSLTVYGTLRSAGGEPRGRGSLIAFGDPRYPKEVARKEKDPLPVRRIAGLDSFDWEPLPYTRREVERIAEVYPGARLYLGEQATEERAKALPREARVLHFATHGYLDDRTPLDSALVLTIPEELPAGRDNGLLQVWEIFESVRLDADLVVLSSCESALGREMSGEGMIGLTRAFQYAGARSVVASLWSVADQATAELMARFHQHRAAGLPTDEALRAAQMELMRGPIRIATATGEMIETDASAPFFWAAFQLFGDWR